MRGQRVMVWHPDSPESRLIVYRPWWRWKHSPFATLTEAIKVHRWRQGDFYDLDAIGSGPVVSGVAASDESSTSGPESSGGAG